MWAGIRNHLSIPLSVAIVAVSLVGLLPSGANAGVAPPLVVDSLRDEVDANPGDGQCDTGGAGTPSNVCTLRAAVMEANASSDTTTILLPEGVIQLTLHGANEDAAATGDLDILQSTTIIGESQGGSIIDAHKLVYEPKDQLQDEPPDRVFHVVNGVNLTLETLTARRGKAAPGPDDPVGCGSTYNGSPLVCDGGGVYLEGVGASLNLDGARLKSNQAEQEGGAIYVEGNDSTIDMDAATLDANRGQFGGGAIYVEGSNATIDIFDSLIGGEKALSRRVQLGNRTDGSGGAIHLAGAAPTVDIEQTSFRNNSAAQHGGALYVADTAIPATINVTDSLVSENVAENQGGGIWLSAAADPDLTITGTEITANHAQSTGGGLYVGTVATADVTITDSKVTRNKGDSGGGGVYYSSAGTLNITDSTFSNNVAPNGGGLYHDDGTATVEGSTFNLNHVDSSGGAIYNNDVLDLTNATLSENSADNPNQAGAGLFNTATGDADLLNVTINKNHGEVGGMNVEMRGLGIFNAGPETAVTVENTIVANSRNGTNCDDADEVDDVVDSQGGNISDDLSCDFDHPSDQEDTEPMLKPLRDNGGDTKTHMPRNGSPAIDQGTSNCPAVDQRDVPRPQDGDGDKTAQCDVGSVEKVAGEDDPASPPPGFDYYVDTDEDSTVCDTNECSLRGAIIAANADPGTDTIYLPSDTYELTIEGTYEDGSATGDLDVTDDLRITGEGREESVIDAKTLRDEGAVEDSDRVFHVPGDLEDGVSLTLNNLQVTGGRSEVAGGGNGVCDNDCNGGGVYVQNNGSELILVDVFLFDNRTHYSGGGVYLGGNGTTLTIEHSQLAGNRAQSSDPEEVLVGGGAIYARGNGAVVNITNSVIGGTVPSAESGRRQAHSNVASDDGGGGGLYVRGNGIEVNIKGSQFLENIADTAGGGAIHIAGNDPKVTVQNARFEDNDSSDWAGGAIYVAPGQERDLTFRKTTFRRNQANNDGPGGAFFVDEETGTSLLIDNSRFEDNKADASGAGIFWDDDSGAGTGLTVTDTWFRGHRTSTQGNDERSTSGGTALVLADGTATLNRVEISDGETESNGSALTNFGDLTMTNTTVSGNLAQGEDTDADTNGIRDGGAVHNLGDMTILNSTFSNNESIYDTQSSPTPGQRVFADADHIYNGGTLRIKNSIVANGSYSEDSDEHGANCFAATDIQSQGHNIEDQNDCDFNSSGDRRNQDPRLGPLANNGGPTRTHRLLKNSPAIDSANNSGCPGVDQRGENRPEDGDKDGNDRCDKGAFEVKGPGEPPTCPGFANSDLNQIVGTNADDVLNGTNKPDIICGKAGKDTIRGLDGDDILLGQTGADKIFGGGGDDRIRANLGGDTVDAGSGNDRVGLGSGGDDVLLGPGRDQAKGHPGNDVIAGEGGKDRINGEEGDDKVRGNGGDDNLRGGGGSDTLNGGADRDKCEAGAQAGDTEVSCEE
jgi:CSLREA domain-containing protein